MSKKSIWGRILLSGASVAAMATPALAQQATDQGQTSDEIVVTATGRAAAIQDIPVAVTALSADTIQQAGVQNIHDLPVLAPSLRMETGQSNSAGTIARIRGIGTGGDNPGFEAAVGVFVDGVYRSRTGTALADLPDVERVEVLRGPQGTLFGRNTSAGAISIITAAPAFENGAWAEGTFGADDLNEASGKAGLNWALSDSLALRFDGSVRSRDGYITDAVSGNDIDDRNRSTFRAQGLWDINSQASLRVIYDHARTGEVCCGITPLAYGSTEGAINGIATNGVITNPTTVTIATVAIDPEGRRMTVTPALPGLPAFGAIPAQGPTPARNYGENTKEDGLSAQLDWDFGGVNFTSITSARQYDSTRNQDVDFNFVDIAYRDGLQIGFDNFTQEFRLQGEAGRLNWLTGVFYGNEGLKTTDRIRTGLHNFLFGNAVATGAGISLGCGARNFYDTTGGVVPSIFGCLSGNPALNAVYLNPNFAGQGQQADHWAVSTESLALFTHDEFNVSDQLQLTLGLRYNHETKDLRATLNSISPSCTSLQFINTTVAPGLVTLLDTNVNASSLMNIACNPAINPIANGSWQGHREENEWSGTASASYHFDPNLMGYISYARGYKAGGFNVDRSGFSLAPHTTSAATLNTGQLAFRPEFTDSYEVGMRSTIFGGSTYFNVTAFYEQIHDYQSNNFNGFNFITQNIPDMLSSGVEVDLLARLSPHFTIQGGLVYDDAHSESTVHFNPLTAAFPNDPNAVFKGQPLTFAPLWSATASITYEMPLADNLQATFHLDGRYDTEYRTQTLNRNPLSDQGAYGILNGRIGIGAENGRWRVDFWGRNLADQFYIVGAFAPPLQNSLVIYPSEPRTWGISLTARY